MTTTHSFSLPARVRAAMALATCLAAQVHGHAAVLKNETASRDSALLSGPVRVEIFEDVPKGGEFELKDLAPACQYTEPAFGFVRMPVKYSRNALPLDRSTPFVLRATIERAFPPGAYEFRLRSKGAAQFLINGDVLLASEAQTPNKSSHDDLPPPVKREGAIRPAPYPHQEVLATADMDGSRRAFTLIAVIGGKGLVPDPDELSVSWRRGDEIPRLLGEDDGPLLTDEGWDAYETDCHRNHAEADQQRRRILSAEAVEEWERYHSKVRAWAQTLPRIEPPVVSSENAVHNDLDRFINARLEASGVAPQPLVSDLEFLRRISLDAIGLIPTPDEVRAYLADPPEKRRERVMERLLAHPGWADHWVSYWQDVLAENPGILKPDLNNSGPFRWWLHQSFVDGIPFDRLVAELVQMEGSVYQGGPAAFKLATLNDAPMAAKADILSQAFMAEKLSCARCHDAPHHPHTQQDTFSIAAMIEGKPVKLPKSSTVPFVEGFRKPRVESSLEPGQSIEPEWPFAHLSAPSDFAKLVPVSKTVPATRRHIAALIVSPENERFAKVAMNRLWKRYLGAGLIEPADDWHYADCSHPELLEYLGREFVLSGYDLKAMARLIFSSHVYQRTSDLASVMNVGAEKRLFAGPARRRMSAEQLVDSLFRMAEKELESEELNLNPLGNRPLSEFLNLGVPARAWQFTALMNERDRPSLALPTAQSIVDVLTTFGWRQSRQNPVTAREDAPSTMQTLLLANGIMGTRIVRLSDDSAFTQLALEDRALGDLIEETFLRILSRPPSAREREIACAFLDESYLERRRESGTVRQASLKADKRVSWANHFDEESSAIRMEEERRLRLGAEPTGRLTADFREAYEDLLWSLINSPEFILIP